MKNLPILFHLIHFVYLGLSVLIIIKRNQLSEWFGLDTADYLAYWALLGLMLYIILWVKDIFNTFRLKRKLVKMESERNKYQSELLEEKNKLIRIKEKASTPPPTSDETQVADKPKP